MTSYVQHVNAILREVVAATPKLVVYGQNVTAGSCLSGLTRGLEAGPGGRLLNTPNVENTQVGVGFGLMLRGVPGLFCVKQQDFVLLGLDHMVNTYNVVRRLAPNGSFTVLAIIVDHGFEGPQSCLNNLSDFCSMANVPGYVVTNRHDAEVVLRRHLVAPGFRMIGVSQRLFGREVIAVDQPVESWQDGAVFRYAEGSAATIVAFNTALPQAHGLWQAATEAKRPMSLFSVTAGWRVDWAPILADLGRTGRLVVVDDSKGLNRPSNRLLMEAYQAVAAGKVVAICREFQPEWLKPNKDELDVDAAAVLARL